MQQQVLDYTNGDLYEVQNPRCATCYKDEGRVLCMTSGCRAHRGARWGTCATAGASTPARMATSTQGTGAWTSATAVVEPYLPVALSTRASGPMTRLKGAPARALHATAPNAEMYYMLLAQSSSVPCILRAERSPEGRVAGFAAPAPRDTRTAACTRAASALTHARAGARTPSPTAAATRASGPATRCMARRLELPAGCSAPAAHLIVGSTAV